MPKTTEDEIIMLERAALDRWGKGDPGGFLELYAPGVSYFDPVTDARIDGHAAMVEYYRPWTGKIQVSRYEMRNPQVVVDGTLALLSYNLFNFHKDVGGAESPGMPWNATVVLQRQGGAWKTIHTHWSFLQHPAFQSLTVQSSEARP